MDLRRAIECSPQKAWDVLFEFYDNASLTENLQKNGISVWVDVVGLTAGVDFLSKIGQAIIDAKVRNISDRVPHIIWFNDKFSLDKWS